MGMTEFVDADDWFNDTSRSTDYWWLPGDLREYKEEQGMHNNFRNVQSSDNSHIYYEKLILQLEKKSYLKSRS